MRKYAQQKRYESPIAQFLIKIGFAKDEKQAMIVMGIIALCAALIGYAFWPTSVPVDTSAPAAVILGS